MHNHLSELRSRMTTDDRWREAAWCIFLALGTIGTLVLYGLLQERIMTMPYNGELFTISAFLVLCNRIVNCMYASSMIAVNGEEFTNKAPLWKYLIVSLANVTATACQYESLKYVSFPVQTLGKSFKMMPVMMWGILISWKKNTVWDWTVAIAVTFGTAEFMTTGPISSPNDHGNSFIGIVLLVVFLLCDGLTSTMQEKLFKEHNTSKFNQMFYINSLSAVVSLVSVLAIGQMQYCLAFAIAHGAFMIDAGLLSAAAAGSQYFIYSQVKEYGALVFAATMNVRQIASILASYITYHHSVTLFQLHGLLVIFGALFYKSYVSDWGREAKKAEKQDPLEVEPLINKEETPMSA